MAPSPAPAPCRLQAHSRRTLGLPPTPPPTPAYTRAPTRSAPLQAPPKKGNLSKEMKARLRKEYVGLGGAENSVRFCVCARTLCRGRGCLGLCCRAMLLQF